jgi:ABC-type Zn uptake system ZnuABC Zn-binding protein ZnuA
MNPLNAAVWAQNVADALAEADPANAEAYAANAAAYIAELEAVDAEIEALVAQIPEESRVLVTNHEFMGYFAARYGFEVAATVLPGGTTGTEVDPQALAELIAFIQAEGVPAIFAEVTANPQLAEIVAQDAGITVVSTLYSESLSDASGPAATYLDYIRYNAQVIVDALAG